MKSYIHKKKMQTARHRRYNRQYRSGGNYIETFITQCIVSGIILSVLLIITIIDVPATAYIRDQFYQTITSTADMTGDARNLGEMIRSALAPANDNEVIGYSQETIPAYTSSPDQDFRIDEDLLRSIRDGERGAP